MERSRDGSTKKYTNKIIIERGLQLQVDIPTSIMKSVTT